MLLAGCSKSPPSAAQPPAPSVETSPVLPCGVCNTFGAFTDDGTVDRVLKELSGLAASHTRPGILYAHNDSGDRARFFALDVHGAKLAEYRFDGVRALDWEDMAVGPCPSGTCVFLGDIGDNGFDHTTYDIYRTPEPGPDGGALPFERIVFRYPDGPHNSETLLVHPSTGDMYIVTKGGNPNGVYRLPSAATSPAVAEKVATIASPKPGENLFTAGDIHPCASRMVLRTYGGVYEYAAPNDTFESIFSATPRELPLPFELQGEAIAYARDGRAIFSASEGSGTTLHRASCAD